MSLYLTIFGEGEFLVTIGEEDFKEGFTSLLHDMNSAI
jgi:hypothetical protein